MIFILFSYLFWHTTNYLVKFFISNDLLSPNVSKQFDAMQKQRDYHDFPWSTLFPRELLPLLKALVANQARVFEYYECSSDSVTCVTNEYLMALSTCSETTFYHTDFDPDYATNKLTMFSVSLLISLSLSLSLPLLLSLFLYLYVHLFISIYLYLLLSYNVHSNVRTFRHRISSSGVMPCHYKVA